MNKILKYVLPVIAVGVFFNAFAVAESNAQILREILNRMDLHYKALQTLKADVRREVVNTQLKDVDKYVGKVVMVPGEKPKKMVPGKKPEFSMLLEWTKPREEILSIVNGKYVMYIPGIPRAYTGSSDSQKVKQGGGGNVLSSLSMSEAELKANYSIEYIGQETLSDGKEVWHLKLTPKVKAKYKFSELWVDKDGMPRQARITANNNDTDTILLTNIKENEKVDGKIFEVSLKKNTEILEG